MTAGHCPECGCGPVGSRAPTCIHCGEPLADSAHHNGTPEWEEWGHKDRLWRLAVHEDNRFTTLVPILVAGNAALFACAAFLINAPRSPGLLLWWALCGSGVLFDALWVWQFASQANFRGRVINKVMSAFPRMGTLIGQSRSRAWFRVLCTCAGLIFAGLWAALLVLGPCVGPPGGSARAALYQLGDVAPFVLGRHQQLEPGADTSLTGVLERLRHLATTNTLDAVLLVGSADRRSLSPGATRRMGDNDGLSRARAEYVHHLIDGAVWSIVPRPPVLVLTRGPAATTANADSVALNGDRSVQVWALAR